MDVTIELSLSRPMNGYLLGTQSTAAIDANAQIILDARAHCTGVEQPLLHEARRRW